MIGVLHSCDFDRERARTDDFKVCNRVLHLSVLLNNEKIYSKISEDKIGVCEKTAGLFQSPDM